MDSKNILQSKTIWGVILMVAGFALNHFFGVTITEDEQGQIIEAAGNGELAGIISTAAGTALAVWGRITAKKDVKVLGS